jgi:hypothetical protein
MFESFIGCDGERKRFMRGWEFEEKRDPRAQAGVPMPPEMQDPPFAENRKG